MLSDKEVKKEFKKKASLDPDTYYATNVLKKHDFERKQCKCGTFFWTVNKNQLVCGDPACAGGFKFIGNSPAKNDMDYIGVWKKFADLFNKWGYTPIKRYPVVARWRDDTDFVQASIYDFQPYVVSGEVAPPANPLVVPQFCLRFNDIDNVGITGAHFTGFVMIGQHQFVPKEEWDQDKVFTDIYNWLIEGLGLAKEEITFHEDAWAGGGNFGPCMEFFSRGLELGNQVYMLYEQTKDGPKELKLKVLDMGMGHERNAWFAKATSTSYEAVFPTVCEKLKNATGIKVDKKLMKKFLPYASYLNVDEVEDIDKAWQDVAEKVNLSVEELRKKILPLAALYSIGEHARTLLVALSDGALPSNTGGGYNLRVILRRALSFIDKYGWKLSLFDVCKWHADYLKPIFPELSDNLNEVKEILHVEKEKYMNSKQKAIQIVEKLQNVDEQKLLQLYDSHGIPPEMLVKAGLNVKVPDNFYAKVAELHEKKEQEHATEKELDIDVSDLQETRVLYHEDYSRVVFKAKVLRVKGKYLVLDKTYFYPTSGGQMHDTGTIQGKMVVEVHKKAHVIVHELKDDHEFSEGEQVQCEINFDRRLQLAQHHTATHIVNAAAKRVLGKHINQAGAKKTIDKSHLDVTHYQAISNQELDKIEKIANKIVDENLPVHSNFMSRNRAEKKFGMAIYQGGAVPGKEIRIIEIPEVDVEACGGTHVKYTSKVGQIKILKATKIQDGIVRITFTAGKAAIKQEQEQSDLLEKVANQLGVEQNMVPARAKELFNKWKTARKAVKKGKKIDLKELELTSDETSHSENILEETAIILSTQPEHIDKTIQRFLKELQEFKEKLKG